MDTIRALIFDDEPEQVVEIQFSLEREWKKFRWPNGDELPRLQPEYVSNRVELLKLIGQSNLKAGYDFFLCDIYVGQPPSGAVGNGDGKPLPEGFRFLKIAKEHGLPLCFALTTGAWEHEPFQKASNEFSQYLDGSYLKGDLNGVHSDSAPQATLRNMTSCLRNYGLIKNLESQLVFDTSIQESRTLAIWEELGEQTVNALASQIAFPGATGVALSSLSPGLSGAKVLKLTYSGSKEDFTTRPVLLKVSRDRQSLQRELDNFRDYLSTPGRRLIHTVARPHNVDSSPIESNGWFAISFECAAPAMSLVDWLTTSAPPADSQVNDLLRGLCFEGHLSDTYKTTAQKSSGVFEGVALGLLSRYRNMAIKEAISEFQPLLSKHVKGKLARLDALRTYIEEGRLDGVVSSDLSKRPSTACLVHGDLHGRNVLVARSATHDNAVLIDIASMRIAIWTVDIVRLTCDLFLSGWDRGVASMEWSGLKSWVAELDLLVRHSVTLPIAKPSNQANRAVRAAVNWLITKKFEIAGLPDDSYHHGEFSLSLGIEFARASYRDRDLPAPKRAFALVVANALIQEASKLFMRSRVRY